MRLKHNLMMIVCSVACLAGCASAGSMVPAASLARGEVAVMGAGGVDGADPSELRGVAVPWTGAMARAGLGGEWELWGAAAVQPGVTWVGSGAAGVKRAWPGAGPLAWSLGAQAGYTGGDYGGVAMGAWSVEAPLRVGWEAGERWGLEARAGVGAYGVRSEGASDVVGGVGSGAVGMRWRVGSRWGLVAEGWGRWTPVGVEGRAGTWMYGGALGVEGVVGR